MQKQQGGWSALMKRKNGTDQKEVSGLEPELRRTGRAQKGQNTRAESSETQRERAKESRTGALEKSVPRKKSENKQKRGGEEYGACFGCEAQAREDGQNASGAQSRGLA